MITNIHEVLSALHKKSIDPDYPCRVWMLGGGGAFNGAHLAGIQIALVEANLHRSLSGVIGVSTSIPALGYMLAAEPGEYERYWHETTVYSVEARSRNFVRRPGKTDVAWVRTVFEGSTGKPIRYENVATSGVRFVGVATDWETGDPQYIEPTSRDEFFTLIEAGCSIPYFAPPVRLRGRLMCDSVTSDPCPVDWLMSLPETERPTHILIAANAWHEPPAKYVQVRHWRLTRWLYRNRIPKHIVTNFALRNRRFYRDVAYAMKRNDVTVAVAWLPWNQRPFERRPKKIAALTAAGYQTFRELINQTIS